MKLSLLSISIPLAIALFGCTEPDNQSSPESATGKPDNSSLNQRDRNDATKTPIDQKENDADLEVTQKIRQAIMEIESLSQTAKNVKVITADEKVTLRGPVKSEEEKRQIVSAATAIAGPGKVDDQLEVAK